MLRQLTAGLAAALLVAGAAGCGYTQTSSDNTLISATETGSEQSLDGKTFELTEQIEQETETTTENSNGVDINVLIEKGDDNMVSMIIAPDFFGSTDEDSIKNEVMEWGADSVMIDGETKYVTAIMSDEAYVAYIERLKQHVEKTMQGLISNNDKFPSITDVTSNEDLTEFTIKCKSGITTEKTISAVDLYMDSAAYQVFSGILPREASVNITYVDEATGEAIDVIDTKQLTAK